MKSFFRFSLLFFRFRPLFRSSPILFVRLLLAFVRSPSFVSLCSFFVSGLSFVQVLSCSFDSSHSFEILSLSLSFVQALPCSFDSSHSFEILSLCWTPADFRWKSFFRFSMLFFFLFRPLFRSSPVLFVRLLSFVCNLSLSLDSCWLSFEVILSFSLLFFRLRPLFRSSPALFVRLLSFV